MFLGSLSLWLNVDDTGNALVQILIIVIPVVLSIEGWVENGDSSILKPWDPALKPVSQLHGASRGRVE